MLALALSLTFLQVGGPREARVIALLNDLCAEEERGFDWYEKASFRRNSGGEQGRVDASFPVSCGNSGNGSIDRSRALDLAADLCSAYGWNVQRDVVLELPGVSATLDVVDLDRKLALELSGPSAVDMDTFTWVPEDEPVHRLDPGEEARLSAEGWHIQSETLDRFPRLDREELGSRLAYLVGVVDFLNGSTEGEDVDLGGLLFERDAWLPLRTSDGPWTGRIGPERRVVLHSQGRVDLEPRGSLRYSEVPGDWLGSLPGESTRGAPSVLLLPTLVLNASEPQVIRPGLRFRQLLDGREFVIDAPPGSCCLFLPSTCDLARPFELELELEAEAGQYRFSSACRMGAAASTDRPRAGQRTEELLALVRGIAEPGIDEYASARFVERPGSMGRAGPVPRFRVAPAFSLSFPVSIGEVGSIALEAFERFGLAPCEEDGWESPWYLPAADVVLEVEGDGRRPARNIGPVPRGALRWTTSRADLECGEGERFPFFLAWLVSLVELLNDTTPGEDVELGGLLFECEAGLEWPDLTALELTGGASVTRVEGGFLRVETPGSVRAHFPGAALPLEARDGAPSVLVFPLFPAHPWTLPTGRYARPGQLVLRQVEPAGQELVHKSRTSCLFLPPGFDLRRPFELELEFTSQGSVHLGPSLRVGAARR